MFLVSDKTRYTVFNTGDPLFRTSGADQREAPAELTGHPYGETGGIRFATAPGTRGLSGSFNPIFRNPSCVARCWGVGGGC